MKAVEFSQKFICFSFVIEDGKRIVNISEVKEWKNGGFRVWENTELKSELKFCCLSITR